MARGRKEGESDRKQSLHHRASTLAKSHSYVRARTEASRAITLNLRFFAAAKSRLKTLRQRKNFHFAPAKNNKNCLSHISALFNVPLVSEAQLIKARSDEPRFAPLLRLARLKMRISEHWAWVTAPDKFFYSPPCTANRSRAAFAKSWD